MRQGAALRGKKADKDGVVEEGSVTIAEPRIFGSIACKNHCLTVSISIVPLEHRKVATSPTKVLSQSSAFFQYGLVPMGCKVIDRQGKSHSTFPLQRSGTGETSVEGIALPCRIELIPGHVGESKKDSQRTYPHAGWDFDVVLS